jgi:hypothetical protein
MNATFTIIVRSIKTFGRNQRYNDDNTAKTIQQSGRDDDKGTLSQTNEGNQEGNQSYSKPGMNATAMNNTAFL